jgi:hypothetical protein
MRKWPPLLWPVVSIASLLILMGGTQGGDAGLLVAGIVLSIAAFAVSVWLAFRGYGDRPKHPGLYLAFAGLAGFYVLIAVGAASAGIEYAIASLLAALIPLTALALLLATIRAKTAGDGEHLLDTTPEADDDPFPGIGMDDKTPLGDTPEHSPAIEDEEITPGGRLRVRRDRGSPTRR